MAVRKPQSGSTAGRVKSPSRSNDVSATKPAAVVDWADVQVQRLEYDVGTTIFAQGDPATSVMYVEQGAVRLSVLSHAGKEAVIAILDVDQFFGEGCLAGQPRRMATARTMTSCTILVIEKQDMEIGRAHV